MRGRKYRPSGAPLKAEEDHETVLHSSKTRRRYNVSQDQRCVPRSGRLKVGNHARKFHCQYCDVKALRSQARRHVRWEDDVWLVLTPAVPLGRGARAGR